MSFRFSPHGLKGPEKHLQRVLEMVPGALSWSILLGMIALAFWRPLLAAVLVIAFDLYWLMRLLYMTLFLVLSYLRLAIEQETDWMKRVRAMKDPQRAMEACRRRKPYLNMNRRISEWVYTRELKTLANSGKKTPSPDSIFHVVIMPVANERKELYEAGVRSLIQQSFPSERILMVLAVEGRSSGDIKREAAQVQRHYRDHFLDFLLTLHPDGVPGENRVKGANATYGAKEAARFLEKRGIPFDHVVVSCFDADTVVSPQYFACLTYSFLVSPVRTRASFQPIPVYHNNIWEVPGFARVLDVGSSFFQLIEATNPEKLVTFSSHSMSFSALVDVGYWPVDMISDDSAIFWKALIHYRGDYRALPMYVTVSMDVTASPSWRKTVLNVYRQKRRWAWGVENMPIVIRAFLKGCGIPLTTRLSHAFKLIETHAAWATWPFLLGLIGWLPAWVAGWEFSDSVVYYSAPRITLTIFNLASVGLFTTVLLSLGLLPKPLVKRPWLRQAGHMLEWLLVPLIAIGLTAIPALDAQTRLLRGKYLEFWVSEKRRRIRQSER